MSSETVRVIREILPGVHERALRELRALIAYSLAAPSPAELREQRLGLLAQMVACAPARIPSGTHMRPNGTSEHSTARSGHPAANSAAPTALGCAP